MKNKSVIEHYKDDVCIIPAEIKSMQTKEILAQIKQIQANAYGISIADAIKQECKLEG